MRPEVHAARKQLPGHIRQRILHVIEELASTPRPSESRTLHQADWQENPQILEWEVRRYRLDDWRIVYAVNDTWHEVAILTIQQRPPYDYQNLAELLLDL